MLHLDLDSACFCTKVFFFLILVLDYHAQEFDIASYYLLK